MPLQSRPPTSPRWEGVDRAGPSLQPSVIVLPHLAILVVGGPLVLILSCTPEQGLNDGAATVTLPPRARPPRPSPQGSPRAHPVLCAGAGLE